ncbi:MAG: transporter [Acidobacteria bacterium]|nr:MAG: transporter [Acidobacteriota bacterium]
MNRELLNEIYYGNTLKQWLIAFAIIVGTLFVSRLLYWLFKSVCVKITSRTKNRLDEIVLDLLEEPILFCVCVAGIWYAFYSLILPEKLDSIINKGVHLLLILTVTWLLVRLVEAFFVYYLKPVTEKTETELDDLFLPIARKCSKTVLWSLGIIIALNNAGYDVLALIAGLGIGGIALAMAAKDTVANVFGGFTILTDHPFTIKDRIRIAGYDGTVTEIGIRSTRLRTHSGTVVTVPNSKFADSMVENISAEPARKVVCKLGLTYDTSPEQMQQALDILKDIAANQEHLTEEVSTAFNDFGDFAMNISLTYYIEKGADIAQTQTEINMAILEKFTKANLDFAFPTQTILTKQID